MVEKVRGTSNVTIVKNKDTLHATVHIQSTRIIRKARELKAIPKDQDGGPRKARKEAKENEARVESMEAKHIQLKSENGNGQNSDPSVNPSNPSSRR